MFYVVMKRFALDDIPVFATEDMMEAYVQAGVTSVDVGNFATEQDMDIANTYIGSKCVSVSVVTFDDTGYAVKNEVIAA
jgi:hypothetical protein